MSDPSKSNMSEADVANETPELTDGELDTTVGGLTSFEPPPPRGGGFPTDNLSLNFEKITWTYQEQTSDGSLAGSVSGGYPLKKS